MEKNLDTQDLPLVLIAAGDPEMLKTLSDQIDSSLYRVAKVRDVEQFFTYLKHKKPDILVLDMFLSGSESCSLCQQVKADPVYQSIPILFVTSKCSPENLVRAFQAGANDYLSCPFERIELRVRLNNLLELKRTRDHLIQANERLSHLLDTQNKSNQLIRSQNEELLSLNNQLKKTAAKDPLTGLYNRRYFTEKLLEEIGRYYRTERPFAIVMGDLDDFKRINDTYGHNYGDTVLQQTVTMMLQEKRQSDVFARWGGEEFVLLLPETDAQGAEVIAERIRVALEEHRYHEGGDDFTVTMTFGVAVYDEKIPMETIIARADDALYYGKAHGKNQVVSYAQVAPLLNR